MACLIDIFPAAIGLLHFVGCFLSFSISLISLIIYIELDVNVNITKPIKVIKKLYLLSIVLLKNIGKNTNKFLIECFNLINFR